ncbi:exopolysaccharide transport family protein [Methylobacterium sp.]|uniref:GumC family protein n=1 Tax=Methylobacterium sp. TaxID=409 RepID=UPI0025F628BC|nr:exopolysaccharide transport family protein [Methylobacterium sp.]
MTQFDDRMGGRSQALALAGSMHAGPLNFAGPELDRTAEIGDLWRILWRRRGWIVWTPLLFVAAALAYGLTTSSLYTATSQILIDPRDRQVMTNDINPVAVAPDGGITQVESQVRLIESASVLGRAIAATKLTEDPEFAGRGDFSAVTDALGRLVGKAPPTATKADLDERTLRALKKRLAIKRADKVFVIDIIITAKSPEKAARLSNAIANAYLADLADARVQAARRASDELMSRLDEQRERVRQAEDRAEAYRSTNDLVRSNGRLVSEQQLSEITLQLANAQSKTAELKARLDQIEQIRRGATGSESTAEALQSAVIGRLRQQFAELSERQADLSSQLGSRHPSIVSIAAQMTEVRGLIAAELGRLARSARADYERAQANEKSLGASLKRMQGETNTTSQASIRLRELEREVEASRTVYTTFLTRAREIRDQAGIDSTNARIITRANPPQEKSWPLPGVFALGGLAAGLGLGTGLAVVREYLNPTVLSRNQMQNLAAAPVIGEIPIRVAKGKTANVGKAKAARVGPAGSGPDTHAASLLLGRLLVLRSHVGTRLNSVFVTSGKGDEIGRRRTAQLLAAVAEARGLRVLYIETDMREEAASPGFLDVLRGERTLNTVIRAQPSTGIRTLGLGRQKRDEVASLDARDRFLDEVGRRFDLVVIEGGALVENIEATPLMKLSDAVLLVADAGVTTQRDLLDATEAAILAGCPVSAGVLVSRAA